MERLGNELRLNFTSVAGQNLVIQSSADLAEDGFTDVPGTATTSSGATHQVMLPVSFAQPQQFYRVKQIP